MRRELVSVAARYARSELERSGSCSSDAALLDWRLRSEGLEVMRDALELAYGEDDTAPGSCPDCGGRTRLLRVEKAPVETVLGSVRVEMARRQCRECGRGGRPRAAAGHRGFDDAVGAAAGESGGFAFQLRGGGRVLRELSGLNFGAKRVERTTRAAGDDLEAWRADAPAAWAARIAEVNKQRRLRTNTASTFTQSTAARQA